jgi:aspartate racemase
MRMTTPETHDRAEPRLIGMIGGTSWQSTALYYRLLNEAIGARLGGLHSARLLLSSVDFAPLESWMRAGDWTRLGESLNAEALRLTRGGAEALVLCTNTMHKVADALTRGIATPFLDIRDAAGKAIVARGCRRPLLLATRYTMRDDFFSGYLARHFGLDPIVPDEAGQAAIDRIIFDELCRGLVRDASRDIYRAIIERCAARGADGVILGCTEIGMLIGQADTHLPVFDTMALHVAFAVDFALSRQATPSMETVL